MTQTLSRTELLKQINTNILKLRTPVIVLYLLIMFILRILGIAYFPNQVFAIVSFMLLSSLILVWFFNKSSLASQTIINSFFAYNLFDIALLTWVMYHFGGLLWPNFIFYSFYMLLNFMIFSHKEAILLSLWIVFLYFILAFVQYNIKPISFPILFPPKQQVYSNFNYVFTTSVAFVSTYILVGFYSFGFHGLYNRRLKEIQGIRDIIQEAVSSLDIRIAATKRELELERKELLVKIEQRKKELKQKEKELKERLEELEEFHKITIGREKVLQELEQKLSKLKAK